jgi:hypothetical protein
MPRLTEAKKTSYHSHLVQATEQGGPLAVVFTGGVQASRWPNSLGIVFFREADSQFEHTYNIEHPQILQMLQQVPQNTVVLLSAWGHGKDRGTQGMKLEPAPAGALPYTPAPVQAPPPQAWTGSASTQQATPAAPGPYGGTPAPQPAPQSTAATPPPQSTSAFQDTRPPTIMGAMYMCLEGGLELVERAMQERTWLAETTSDALLENARVLAATMFIEWMKSAGNRPFRKAGGDE